MRVPGLAATALCLAAAAAGCGGSPRSVATVPAEAPASPATWPAYPAFRSPSCWARSVGGGVLRAAPSVAPARTTRRAAPSALVRRLLRRLGDRRFVRRIVLAPPPPVTLRHLRGYFGGLRPPRDALWAYVAAPAATAPLGAHPSPAQVGRQLLAEWEAALAVGALRDDFCAAGGPPLVGWTTGRGGIGVSDRSQAFEQRFPNPAPAAYRQRVALVGSRYGFRVASLRLLRPRQVAPLLVVRTSRSRTSFVRDVPAILRLLDPVSSGRRGAAVTFEGFFFEARDRDGAFVRVENVYRGEVEGGEWAWNPCDDPYPHSEPLGARSCPG
jgi:hypothetical protein